MSRIVSTTIAIIFVVFLLALNIADLVLPQLMIKG